MTHVFANNRICVYRSPQVELSAEETPVAFSTTGSMHVGVKDMGKGKFSITSKRVVFEPSSDSPAIGFDYRSMVMHALTSDEARKYIFVQLLSDEDEEQEAEDEVIKLVPDDELSVAEMFEKMNEMSALNPDDDGENTSEFEACADGEF
jgi:hypothetical protein